MAAVNSSLSDEANQTATAAKEHAMENKSALRKTVPFRLPAIVWTGRQANLSRRVMSQFGLLCEVMFMLVVQGCMVLPVPNQPMAGTRIEAARLQFIQPGVTSRSRVFQELGPPDGNFEDIQVIAYAWESRAYLGVWITPTGDTGAQMFGKPHVLLIEFNENGHVRRFELTSRGQHDTIRSRAAAWAKAGTNSAALRLPNRFVPVPIPSGKSVIHVYRPGGFEVPYVAVSVILDGQPLADLRSKECISVAVEPGSHPLVLRPHSLSSSFGSLSVGAVERTIRVNATPNKANYLEVTVPAGRGRLDPDTETLPEKEAMQTLAKLKPW
jgi:hypothetical protein